MSEKIIRELNTFINIVQDNRHDIKCMNLYNRLSVIPSYMLFSKSKYKYMFWYHAYKLILLAMELRIRKWIKY